MAIDIMHSNMSNEGSGDVLSNPLDSILMSLDDDTVHSLCDFDDSNGVDLGIDLDTADVLFNVCSGEEHHDTDVLGEPIASEAATDSRGAADVSNEDDGEVEVVVVEEDDDSQENGNENENETQDVNNFMSGYGENFGLGGELLKQQPILQPSEVRPSLAEASSPLHTEEEKQFIPTRKRLSMGHYKVPDSHEAGDIVAFDSSTPVTSMNIQEPEAPRPRFQRRHSMHTYSTYSEPTVQQLEPHRPAKRRSSMNMYSGSVDASGNVETRPYEASDADTYRPRSFDHLPSMQHVPSESTSFDMRMQTSIINASEPLNGSNVDGSGRRSVARRRSSMPTNFSYNKSNEDWASGSLESSSSIHNNNNTDPNKLNEQPTFSAPEPSPPGLSEHDIARRLAEIMTRSAKTQEALQNWDKQNGLPKSHSQTMVNSSRSRKQLQDGVILRKWDGSPLIDLKTQGEGFHMGTSGHGGRMSRRNSKTGAGSGSFTGSTKRRGKAPRRMSAPTGSMQFDGSNNVDTQGTFDLMASIPYGYNLPYTGY